MDIGEFDLVIRTGVPALTLLILLSVLAGGCEDPREQPEDGKVSEAELAQRRGALVDEVVFTREAEEGKVAGLIERGSHHLYAQGITNPTVYNRLRDSLKADYEIAYGASAELTLNPVGPEFEDGSLNPFSDREIREAMNWLIDRRHVAEEIYGGMAAPRALPLNTVFPDYARLAETMRELELHYGHDPDRAVEVISERLEALGAERRNGRWYYDDSPVTISIVIRTDDERHQVGDYFANLMEDLGFRTERLYRTAEESSRIVMSGNPAAGRWHVYTGGWISILVNRDLSDNFSYYYTSRGRGEPLWQAYDPDEEFEEVSERLDRRDYETLEERLELMARAVELAMRESYRIWLVDQISIIPRATNVSVAADLAGGVSGSNLWAYTLRFNDRLGGRMVIGAPNLLGEPWNPVEGSNWAIDRMITRGLSDAAVIPDPFTGLYRPQRIRKAEVTVKRGLPVGHTLDWVSLDEADEISVPEDAYIGWDAESERFRTVADVHPDGVNARSRTVIHYEDGYLDRKWHDGTRMSLADMLLPRALMYARADEDSPLFDPGFVPAFQVFEHHFRGWRILSEEPLVIEVFSDQIFPDAESIVAARAMSASPWHVLALGIMAESANELAFSSFKADTSRIDWMNLVAGPSLEILNRHLESAREHRHVPFEGTIGEFVDDEQVDRRYEALADWYEKRNHFWVGDGAFYLHSVHPVERMVVLRRYEDFPDPADRWLDFDRPPIPEVTIDGPMMVTPETEALFTLDITLAGEPHPTEDIEEVRYLLFDGDENLQARGQADYQGDGRWTVKLSMDTVERLGMGANSLEVAITSGRIGMPTFGSFAFATVPAGVIAPEDAR